MAERRLMAAYVAVAVIVGAASPLVPYVAAFIISLAAFGITTAVLVKKHSETKPLLMTHLFLYFVMWIITWTVARGV